MIPRYSDVLIRHLKNHPQLAGDEAEQSSSDGDHGQGNDRRRRPSTSSVAGTVVVATTPMNDSNGGPSHVPDLQPRPMSPSRIDPALLGPAGEYHEQGTPHPSASAMSSGLDHLALLASQQAWGNGHVQVDTAMTDAASTVIAPPNESQNWGHEPPSHNQEFGNVISYQQGPTPADPDFQMMSATSHPHAGIDFGNDLYSGRLSALQDQISPGMGGVTPNGTMMPHDLLNWFDQFDMDNHQPADGMPSISPPDNASVGNGKLAAEESPQAENSKSPGSVSTIIPTERFHKVERCWPSRPNNAVRLMPTLWRDAISKPEDNLFSKDNLTPEAIEHNRQYGSRWGLDEECRGRLQKMFVDLSRRQSSHGSESDSPFTHSSPSDKSSIAPVANLNDDVPNIPNFPPAEIFDISLDLFFRQFHPLMPFIHPPTFCPQTTPTSMLLVMCLIGLTILETKGATAFVRQAFPVCNRLVLAPFLLYVCILTVIYRGPLKKCART